MGDGVSEEEEAGLERGASAGVRGAGRGGRGGGGERGASSDGDGCDGLATGEREPVVVRVHGENELLLRTGATTLTPAPLSSPCCILSPSLSPPVSPPPFDGPEQPGERRTPLRH